MSLFHSEEGVGLVAISAATATSATAAATTTVSTATTATVASASAAESTATAAATEATTAASAAATIFFRACLIDGQGASSDLLTIECGYCGFRLCIRAHLYKAKSFGSSRISVSNNPSGCHCSVLSEELL
jgi:hypothetical protein